jgi:hypothetical protein
VIPLTACCLLPALVCFLDQTGRLEDHGLGEREDVWVVGAIELEGVEPTPERGPGGY